MMGFLRDERGETFGEALAAFVIAALAVAVFAGMVSVSTNVTDTSRDALQDVYAATSATESATSGTSATLNINLESLEGAGMGSANIASYGVTVYEGSEGGYEFERYELGGGGS